jgi:hypothetical protein
MWTPVKPKFKKECLLLTASKIRDEWSFNSWWVRKVEDGDGMWFMELCTIDGDEWGELSDLDAEFYKVVGIPKKGIEAQDFIDTVFPLH